MNCERTSREGKTGNSVVARREKEKESVWRGLDERETEDAHDPVRRRHCTLGNDNGGRAFPDARQKPNVNGCALHKLIN